MKDLKILSEDESQAGYLIPKQEIAATDEQEAITQRDESVRVYRKASIDPVLEKIGGNSKHPDAKMLPHPRMRKVEGSVFVVSFTDQNGLARKAVRHESKLPAEVVADFRNPVDTQKEAEQAEKEKAEQTLAEKQKVDQEKAEQERKQKDAEDKVANAQKAAAENAKKAAEAEKQAKAKAEEANKLKAENENLLKQLEEAKKAAQVPATATPPPNA
ncbi:hypothetical protein BWI93_05415 [Siphonobacter sp. BAB-5385]|uniref:hypothetical protein n=1 Tax=Siphonobacter sp. BAB-5385 TaxID=1864822 RepID=UPI000B9E946E|nr:hypothetical protein [Siphonobacter sp. BAB-5385]OZI09186.1 hypothetical protein BWI93_05415 [Siphonobacter sp. BAB-5385]